MTEKAKKLIEENMDMLEITVKALLIKFKVPWNDADEYRQTGYLALCKNAHRYDGRTKFTTFANTVMNNAFIDKCRHDNVKNTECLSFDEPYAEDDDGNGLTLMSVLSTPNDTENEALTRITRELIRKNIKDAKAECGAKTIVKGFEALELKLEGYTGEEIAGMFDVPSNYLRSWMSKAKKILLADYGVLELIMD